MPLDVDRIRKPVRKLRKFLKKAPKRPSSDRIHDLRTNTRRFESTIYALGLASKRNERRLLLDLSRVRKRAGKIRDKDVLTGFALKVNLDGEQDCLVQLLEHLGTSRGKHAKKLRALIQKVGAPLRRRLKRSSAHIEKLLDQPGNNNAAAPAETVAKAIQLSSELKDPPRLDKKNLHPYRLKVKALRYVLQLADRSDQQAFVDKLGEVKDGIGEWHDWEELIAIATGVLDHGSQCKLLQKLKSISNEKYEHALSLTNHMRKTYLHLKDSDHANRHRHAAKTPSLPPRVLAAAYAISA